MPQETTTPARFCWSTNGEIYHAHEPHADRESALAEAMGDSPETELIYIAEKKEFSAADFVCIENIIESIQEQAYESVNESSQDYLEKMTEDHKKELSTMICDFLDKHYPVDFWGAENIDEVRR